MAAPKCPEDGCTATRIYPGMSSATLISSQPYWEDGKYHYHDLNTTTTNYGCGAGHSWTVKSKASCPSCGFPQEAGGEG